MQFYEVYHGSANLSPLVRDLPWTHNLILQELGSDFCFIGEEFRMQVGNKDFFLDLLFYHRGLECLVVFDSRSMISNLNIWAS